MSNKCADSDDTISQHLQDSSDHYPLPECQQALDQHLNDSDSPALPTIIKCNQCDESFDNESSLNQHMCNSQCTSALSCQQCNKKFRAEYALSQHMHDSHQNFLLPSGTSSNDMFCGICDKWFRAPAYLQQHNASPVHRPRSIKCFVCSSMFKTPSGLAHHTESSCENLPLNRHEVTAAIQALVIVPEISLRPAIEGQGVTVTPHPLVTYHATAASFNGIGYECSICSKTFRALPSLDAHLNSPAHDEDEFKCPRCEQKFKLTSCLVQHLESGSCGLSSVDDVEERFRNMIAQFSHALKL